MKQRYVRLFWSCLLASAMRLWGAEDLVLSTQAGEVAVDLFIPGNVQVLRGLYVHAANYSLQTQDRWAESGRTNGFGHIAMNFKDVRRAQNRQKKLRNALEESLILFAEKSGHSELLNVPFVGIGHSAGGLVTSVLLEWPERTLTVCVDCGWICDAKKFKPAYKSIPMLFTLGGIPDAYNMLADITNNFVPARQEGWLWGLGVQHGCAHDFGNAATLMIPWIEAVISARLPKGWDPLNGPPELQEMKLEEGWLGDVNSIDSTWANIGPCAKYKGDKTLTTWLPNGAVAHVWRAWETKDSPVKLHISSLDDKVKLEPWRPKADRTLLVNQGIKLKLSVLVEPELKLKRVSFYDGDRKINECNEPPWETQVKQSRQGPHAISALWETNDGRFGAANPALVVVRRTPLPE